MPWTIQCTDCWMVSQSIDGWNIKYGVWMYGSVNEWSNRCTKKWMIEWIDREITDGWIDGEVSE